MQAHVPLFMKRADTKNRIAEHDQLSTNKNNLTR